MLSGLFIFIVVYCSVEWIENLNPFYFYFWGLFNNIHSKKFRQCNQKINQFINY